MTNLKTIGAAALLATTSLSAMAADLPSRVAPPPPPPLPVIAGWDGLYVGTTYGYGWTNFNTRQEASRSRTESGQLGGGLIGYNFQSGHFVYGAEGSIDLNVIRGNVGGVDPGLTATRLDTLYDIRLRGIVGYEFGWFMPFIAGGAVINETYQSFSLDSIPYGDTRQTVGWTVGGGVDFKINPSQYLGFLPLNLGSIFGPLVFRVEYIHDSLPRETYTIGPIGTADRQTFRTESDSNIVRAAIIYRFGDTAPHPYADALGNVNWAGGYGGILGGYGDVNTRTRSNSIGTGKINSDGGIGGLYAGTNFMFYNNKIMLGVDGATAFSDITGNGSEPGAAPGSVRYREYVNADARVRVGYAFGRFLPFAAGGIVFTRSEQVDRATGSELGRVPADNWTIGGGLDYRVTERVSVRGEYLYERSFNDKHTSIDGCTDCVQRRESNVVRFGAAYHFE